MPVIVCFSYGLSKDGDFTETNRARCERAAQLYKVFKRRYPCGTGVWIIVTAGTIPNFPAQKKHLCMMQRETLEQLGVSRLHILPHPVDFQRKYEEKNILSTAAEIDAALAIADETKDVFGPFYATSHWYQMPRICWLGRRRGIRFVSRRVWRATPWRNVVMEIPKWIVAFVDYWFPEKNIGRRATALARAYHIW